MSKIVDYFVICGLDYNSGLEPDKFAGYFYCFKFLIKIFSFILTFAEDNLHVSPLERSYKGKVLAHYPENVPSNPFDESAVCMVS